MLVINTNFDNSGQILPCHISSTHVDINKLISYYINTYTKKSCPFICVHIHIFSATLLKLRFDGAASNFLRHAWMNFTLCSNFLNPNVLLSNYLHFTGKPKLTLRKYIFISFHIYIFFKFTQDIIHIIFTYHYDLKPLAKMSSTLMQS